MKYNTIPFLQIGAVALLFALTQGCNSTTAPAKTEPLIQTTYASPQDAVTALVDAAQAHDRAKLNHIFGPEGEEILSSGDEVADHNAAEKFVSDYDDKHQLTTNDDGSVTVTIGTTDWPLPIPLVKDDNTNKWHFDTPAGKEEILNRRIGNNELYTINVCQAVADAQREYAQLDPDNDGVPEYAQKFLSDPGTKNGLFWKTNEGEPPSPLGEIAASAAEQGYTRNTTDQPSPYHGYCYKMLKSQGPGASGGARDYIVNGKMIGGFAVVAYPAEYGNSGVMTFIMNHEGVVYQQDLGDKTAQTAQQISTFDPGTGWEKVEAAAK